MLAELVFLLDIVAQPGNRLRICRLRNCFCRSSLDGNAGGEHLPGLVGVGCCDIGTAVGDENDKLFPVQALQGGGDHTSSDPECFDQGDLRELRSWQQTLVDNRVEQMMVGGLRIVRPGAVAIIHHAHQTRLLAHA
ncbi:hypothetical protein D3C71_1240320 [compost metagenome]